MQLYRTVRFALPYGITLMSWVLDIICCQGNEKNMFPTSLKFSLCRTLYVVVAQ